MTREEILNYFRDINFMYNNSSMFDTLKRMLDELTEPCEDCVSRKEVIFIVQDIDMKSNVYEALRLIKNLPRVYPTLPTMVYPQVPGVTPTVVSDGCECTEWKEKEQSCLECLYYPDTAPCDSCEGYSNYNEQ